MQSLVGFNRLSQRLARAEKVALPDDVIQTFRAHSRRQRLL